MSPTRRTPAVVFVVALLSWAMPPAAAQEAASTLRVREIYVPYEEFASRTREAPDGILMDLAEYRALVLKGLLRDKDETPPELPPIAAEVIRAEHRGVLHGNAARFRSHLEVMVTQEDGWALCDLGVLPARIGEVAVDGRPGWLLIDRSQRRRQPKRKSAEPNHRGLLLLQGAGRHRVEIGFSSAALEAEDSWSVSDRLPRAATAVLTLDVPGHAEARATPPFLATEYLPDVERSRLTVALGTADDFSLSWRRRRSVGENDALLAAEHGITVLPRRANPVFVWEATVEVNRRKTDRLAFREPGGTTVVKVSGERVHSWSREGDDIVVLLNEEVLGDVELRFDGFLLGEEIGPPEAAGKRFALSPPRLVDAFTNTGYLALCDPDPDRLEVSATDASLEVALEDAAVPSLEPAPLARVFSFASTNAGWTVDALPEAAAFETRAACLVSVGEDGVGMEAVYQIRVIHGRLFRLEFTVPTPWRLRRLQAVDGKGKSTPLVFEIVESGATTLAEVTLPRAATEDSALQFQLELDHEGFDVALDADQELSFAVPVFVGARRAHVDLGIAIAESMDARIDDQAGWRGLDRRALEQVGLDVPGLAAGLTSTQPAENAVSLTLAPRPVRGSYEAVSYLLALERSLRVRVDVRLAVVDHPVDEIRLRLPVPRNITVKLRGDGLKVLDRTPEASTDERFSEVTVPFTRPWVGTRQLRVEYELPHVEGEAPAPVPAFEVLGNFTRSRFIVFQSDGSVELTVLPGGTLEAMNLDDLPELGEPWKRGRLLFAYRVRQRGEQATLFTKVHPRHPILEGMAKELILTTVLGASGVSRTEAEAWLAYTGHQYVEVELPADSRLLAVKINGEAIQSLKPVTEGGPEESVARWSIPLPPRTYGSPHTIVTLSYERPANGRGSKPLRYWGAWRENGPRFRGFPVGTTRWRLYHPRDFRFFVGDRGNLLPSELIAADRVRSFAAAFFGRLLRGEWPRFVSWQSEHPGRVRSARSDAAASPKAAARSAARNLSHNILQAQNDQQDTRTTGVSMDLKPEGVVLDLGKLGGEPRLDVSYRELVWWNRSRPAMFLFTLLLGLSAVRRGGRRTFYYFCGWGLFVGTLLPVWTGWESPFFWMPFCEGLVALLLGAAVVEVGLVLGRLAARARRRRRALLETALLVGAATLLPPALVTADEKASPPPGICPDGVIIPYSLDRFPALDEDAVRVYLPRKTFLDLWKLANPEEVAGDPKPPVEMVPGSVDYALQTTGATYTLKARFALELLTDKWTTLPLPFDKAQLSRVVVDGEEVGVFEQEKMPVIGLKGRGTHRLELELSGAVRDRLGNFAVATRLLPAVAARLRAALPPGASPTAHGASAGPLVVETTAEGTQIEMDLGAGEHLDLRWTFPQVAGSSGSTSRSISYSVLTLTLDGYGVERHEKLRVSGRPVSSATYRVVGDWQISEVAAPEIAEWSIEEEDGVRRLEVFFVRPVETVDLLVRGRAPLGGSVAGVASLELAGAVQQVSFFGLKHASRRRWQQESLRGLRRAARQELTQEFPAAQASMPDRIYQTYGSGAGESVSASPTTGTVRLTTDCIALVSRHRVLVTARTRYRVKGPGPFRHELSLPRGWNVRTAGGANVRSWDVAESEDDVRLVLFFNGRVATGGEVLWTAEVEEPSFPFDLPGLRAETFEQSVTNETIHWVVTAPDSLELSPGAVSGLMAISLKEAPVWVKPPPGYSHRFAYRSEGPTPDYALPLEATTPESRVEGVVVAVARLVEEFLQVNARVVFKVRRAGRDRFVLRLPPGVDLVGIESGNQKSLVKTPTATGLRVALTLISPIVGEHVVTVAYRQPRPTPDADVVLLPLELLDGETPIEDVDHFIGVLSPRDDASLTRSTEARPQNLVAVPASGLPYLPEGIDVQSLRPTYRARDPNWSLTLAPGATGREELLPAIIELASLVTTIGDDGTWRTRVVYTLRNSNAQFLKVELPADADLWGVTLADRPALVSKVEQDGAGRLLQIPLEYVGEGDLSLEVALMYAQPALRMPLVARSVELTAPRVVDMKVRSTSWRVELPRRYEVVKGGGNVHEVPASVLPAEDVRNLLTQIDRVQQVVENSASIRLRKRAADNMRQLERALSDKVSDLGEATRQLDTSSLETAKEQQLWQFSQAQLRDGERMREALKAQQEAAEKRATGDDAARTEFEDGYRFLENDWSAAARDAGAVKQPAPSDAVDLDGLSEWKQFAGLALETGGRGARSIDRSEAQAVNEQALAPLEEKGLGQVIPALLTPPAPDDRRSLTFQYPGGEATLALSISARGVWPRIWAAVVFFGAIGWFLWRRRRVVFAI